MSNAHEYSGTRLYLGNLPKDVRKQEVEDFFKEHGHGNIVEIKLMSGFGFIQYDNEEDTKEIVPAYHGRDFKGQRLTVQFARGSRHNQRENFGPGGPDRSFPRPRRTAFRMNITGLQPDTSWQDLKDFARRSNVDVVFSEVSRERDGRGMVEFESYDDLKQAVAKLDATEFKGARITCIAEDEIPTRGGGAGGYNGPGRHGRSRSPGGYGGGGGGGGRYSPPGGRHHSPPRYGGRSRHQSPPRGYRERSPPHGGPRGGPREPYYGGGRDRSPPRRPLPPVDDYPPARTGGTSYGGGGSGAREDYPPPRRGGGYDDDTYAVNGGGRRGGGYDEAPARGARPPSIVSRGRTPPRGPPPRNGGYDDYDHRPRRW